MSRSTGSRMQDLTGPRPTRSRGFAAASRKSPPAPQRLNRLKRSCDRRALPFLMRTLDAREPELIPGTEALGRRRYIEGVSKHPGQDEENDEHVCGKDHDAFNEPSIGALMFGPILLRGRGLVSFGHLGCPVVSASPSPGICRTQTRENRLRWQTLEDRPRSSRNDPATG